MTDDLREAVARAIAWRVAVTGARDKFWGAANSQPLETRLDVADAALAAIKAAGYAVVREAKS